MTPEPGSSFVALSKHIRPFFIARNRNLIQISLSYYLNTKSRKFRVRLSSSGMARCRGPVTLLGSVSRTGILWVKMFSLAELGHVFISELVPVEWRTRLVVGMRGSRQQVMLGSKVILKSNVKELASDKSWGEGAGWEGAKCSSESW